MEPVSQTAFEGKSGDLPQDLINGLSSIEDFLQKIARYEGNYTADLQQAEKSLHESYAWIRMLARLPEENPNPMLRVTEDGRILYFNPAATKTGWQCEIGGPLPEGLQPQVSQAMAQGSQLLELEVEIGGKNYSVSVIPFPEEHYANLYIRDITRRTQVERALKQSVQRERTRATELQAIMDTVPAIIWIARDAECRLVEANKAGYQLVGMTPGSNLSRTAPMVEDPRAEAPESATATRFRTERDGQEILLDELPVRVAAREGIFVHDYEFTLAYEQDSRIDLIGNAAPLFDETGKPAGAVGAFIDITVRKKMEQDLKDQAEKLGEQTKKLDLAHVLARDMNDRIIFWNRGAEEMYGWTKEEALGKISHELFHTVFPESLEKLTDALRNTGVWEGELVHLRRDGSQVVVASHQVVHLDKANRPAAIIEVNNDVTGLKRAEQALQEAHGELEERVQERTEELEVANEELKIEIEETERVTSALVESEVKLRQALKQEQAMRTQLVQSEKYAALARLVASVAHELNNPIQTIQNCIYLLREKIGPESEEMQIIEMADSESKRIAMLVSQLKETYRPSRSNTAETFNILDVLQSVQNILEPHLQLNQCKMTVFSGEGPILVDGLADQIKQVFLNISLNAIEAMQPGGGPISVFVTRLTENKQVAVAFKDQGTGIPEEYQKRLFEPFFTTKPKGTGLGLSICYEIVKSHGGSITVESKEGKGATFIVHLPLAEQAGVA